MTLKEIDALVHEKFFGLSKDQPVKEYTTNWSAAMDIATSMKNEWPDFCIHGTAEAHWQVCWGYDGHGWDGKHATTLPLALCIAGLASKEHIIEPPYDEETK